MHPHNNPKFIHHQRPGIAESIREVVFGMEDGMVSTMGAITGIAIGSENHFIVVLAGIVIVSVESISMGVGSYLSNKSEREVDERMLSEEQQEIREYPKEEKKELFEFFVRDGWPARLAAKMAAHAGSDKQLMLREMAYRELHVSPHNLGSPAKNGVLMWGSYVIGGLIPLLPYLLIATVVAAIPISISITLIGLFLLGAGTTRYTNRTWWKAGIEMFLFAGFAALIGYLVGAGVELYLPMS